VIGSARRRRNSAVKLSVSQNQVAMQSPATSSPLQIEGIDIWVEGSTRSDAPTIVMIHGWPDTYRLWDAQVAALKEQHRCVRFTLPGFDIGQPALARSIDELVGFFEQVIRAVSPSAPVVLMLHDWGCVFGYEFYMRHPELVQRIVGVDIGDAGSAEYLGSLSIKAKLMIVSYQSWLAIAWALGGRAGDWMTRFMARALRSPSPPAHIGVGMCYPYYIRWTGRHGSYQRLAQFAPSCPMLFLYGRKKPFMFHSTQWVKALNARPGSRAIELNTAHWLMLEQPAQFNAAVIDWLAA
jgi:cis-3-alkyl-4-acyloxetan-2-one decarboxylase